MSTPVRIVLTVQGANTGPFALYTNLDGYTTPFDDNGGVGIPGAWFNGSGYLAYVPDGASIIRVCNHSSNLLCDTCKDLDCLSTTTSSSSTAEPIPPTTVPPTTVEPTTTQEPLQCDLWICGGNYASKSDDSGVSWTRKYTSESLLFSVSFLNIDLGFLTGAGDIGKVGCVIRTDDAGENWTDQAVSLPDDASNRTFYSSTKELTDYMYIGSNSSLFMKYDRVADSWTTVEMEGTPSHNSYDLTAVSDDVVVSITSLSAADNYVLRTNDGGTTWTAPLDNPPEDDRTYRGLDYIEYDGDYVGCIVSGRSSSLWKIWNNITAVEANAGNTWNGCYTGNLHSTNAEDEEIECYDPMVDVSLVEGFGVVRGFIVGYDYLTSEGKLWYSASVNTFCLWSDWTSKLPANTPRLTCVKFYDYLNGWIGTCDGRVLYTTDGGNSWTFADGKIGGSPVQNIMVVCETTTSTTTAEPTTSTSSTTEESTTSTSSTEQPTTTSSTSTQEPTTTSSTTTEEPTTTTSSTTVPI